MAYMGGIWASYNPYRHPDLRQLRPDDPRQLSTQAPTDSCDDDNNNTPPVQSDATAATAAVTATTDKPFNIMGLPWELRQMIYRWVVASADWQELDWKLNEAANVTLSTQWHPPPKTETADLMALCLAHPQLAREALPVFYSTAVPRIVCTRSGLKPLDAKRKNTYHSSAEGTYPLLDTLSRFRYMRLDELSSCSEDRVQDVCAFVERLAATRDVGVHLAIEDLAKALRSWFFSPITTAKCLYELLHHPRVAVFLWSYPLARVENERLAETGRKLGHCYRAGYDASEEQIAQACRALDLDRSRVIPNGWRPEQMLLGSKWAQKRR